MWIETNLKMRWMDETLKALTSLNDTDETLIQYLPHSAMKHSDIFTCLSKPCGHEHS